MFSITDAAMQHLYNSLSSSTDPEPGGKCFRIVRTDDNNLRLNLEKPVPGDATYDYEGSTVLALPTELQEFCSDKSLDIDENGKLELA